MFEMKQVFLSSVFLCMHLAAGSVEERIVNPIVNIPSFGDVQGVWRRSSFTKQKYAYFKDMPYAKYPVERFQPPIPVDAHEGSGPYNGRYFRSIQASINQLDNYESHSKEEDWEFCQYLSVATKNLKSKGKEKYPVMVRIEGFDLEHIDPLEVASPNFILEENVVFVSIRYRVGVLGFLSTLTEEIPGNVGIQDVILALKWVKKNIKYFGGDPDNITVMGQYKAAAILHLIELISEKKLFNRMILQSGSALLHDLETTRPLDVARGVGEHLNCDDTKDVSKLNACLKEANSVLLVDAYRNYKQLHPKTRHFTIGGKGKLIPKPIEQLAEEAISKVEAVLAGSVMHPAAGLGKLTSAISSEFLEGLSSGDFDDDFAHDILDTFPKEIYNQVIRREIWPASVDINSLDIKDSVAKAVKYYSSNEDINCYLYIFNYDGSEDRLETSEDENEYYEKVGLLEDDIYLFPHQDETSLPKRRDRKMAKIMIDLWTSFTEGSPKSSGYVDDWPKVVSGTMGPYLKIDNNFEIGWNYPEEYFQTVLQLVYDTAGIEKMF